MEVDQLLGKTHSDYVSHSQQRMEDAYNVVQENVHGAQKHQKQHYDCKVVGERYCIGDLAWLYCPAILKEHSAKFHQPWKDPFEVIKVL